MKIRQWLTSGAIGLGASLLAGSAYADFADCSALPNQAALRAALQSAVAGNNGGLGFNMWATLVAIDGTVCAVAFSGADYTGQWLASRVISAQKANTANGLSLSKTAAKGGLALSTANLYSAVQPGGSLYGLQHSNPVDAAIAYEGSSVVFGTANDPLVGNRVGGVNVFGGGLALYKPGGVRIGGVGVSGDTSCTDHMVAWRVRANLGLDLLNPVGGVSGDPKRPDNIVFDITPNPNGGTGISAGGFGHPTCLNNPDRSTLPPVH
jgi:uncharacterized protein GlcG (DUF336 family)